jgi:multicomponent Na+:H+ antiporter subunit C
MNPILSFIIILIGLYGVATSKNIIKSIICINIIQTGTILLLLNIGNMKGGEIPIVDDVLNIVDPIPQALMITAIVIGSTITALGLILSIKIFHYYGSLTWKEVIERDE